MNGHLDSTIYAAAFREGYMTLAESDGHALAHEAWDAWCENEALHNVALETLMARSRAHGATMEIHQRILAARRYLYYERAKMQSPDLTEARRAERLAEDRDRTAWMRAHEAWEDAADALALFCDWTHLYPETYGQMRDALRPPVAARWREERSALIGGPFVAGERVRHLVFGEGTVLVREVVGDQEEVLVVFTGAQGQPIEKRMVTAYAKLERETQKDQA